MAYRRKKGTRGRTAQRYNHTPLKSFLLLVVTTILFVITLNTGNHFSDTLPTWDGLYRKAGLSRTAPAIDGEVSVHFIDVGQGDSALILTPDAAVLIDGGETDAGPVVLDYLKALGVEKLSLVIGTHPHSDHIGGLSTVLEELPADKVIVPRVPDELTPTTSSYERLLDAVEGQNLRLTPAKAGDRYAVGDGALEILAPVQGASYDGLNDYSVVCRFTYGGRSFLFTGDAEKPVERDLLAEGTSLASDVLKVGHHGSNTSSTKDFLAAVSPEYAVVSCGTDNRYGHPHKEVMARLSDAGVTVLRTDLGGSIVFSLDESGMHVQMEKGGDDRAAS